MTPAAGKGYGNIATERIAKVREDRIEADHRADNAARMTERYAGTNILSKHCAIFLVRVSRGSSAAKS